MTPIYACLAIPNFSAASVQRAVSLKHPGSGRPSPQDAGSLPLAVFTGKAPHRTVFCANAAARAGGVHEGMPLAEASARFADTHPGLVLVTHEREEAAEQQAWRETLEMALRISPRIEDSAPGLLLADLAGLPNPHRSAYALHQGATALGLQNNVGVSMNRFVAECAARAHTGVTHVYPGQESALLHVLPVSFLPLDDAARQTLGRWGIRTLGAFVALPEKEVADRLGANGVYWLRMARGQHESLFQSHSEKEEFTEQTDFDWQVADLEPLAFTLTDLLSRLCQRLQHKGLAAGKLRVALKLASGNWYERELLLPTAHTDASTFVTLARLDLSSHPPGEPVEGLRVCIEPAPRRTAQYSLFEPVQPCPEKLDVTLARLHNLVNGSESVRGMNPAHPAHTPEVRVGAPVVADTHRYDVCTVQPYAPPKASSPLSKTISPTAKQLANRHAPIPLRMVLRCLRPAPEAEVRIARARPVHLSAHGLCHGNVDRAAGPWRLGSEWWTDSAWDFEEWDVAIGCQIYRIRCELPDLVWRVAGVYD